MAILIPQPFARGAETIAPDELAADGSYPSFSTARFRMRPFALADIESLVALANEHRVADTAIGVPYPYTHEFAREWIGGHADDWHARRALHWAAIPIGDEHIAGYAGLHTIDFSQHQAELRFWVGRGVERRSFGTEWAAAVVDFAIKRLELNRIYALQLARHPLAGRILGEIGMQPTGLVRKRYHSGGLIEDANCWSITRSEWLGAVH